MNKNTKTIHYLIGDGFFEIIIYYINMLLIIFVYGKY